MGCNVPDIDLVVVAGDPNTVSAVAQRWGRAARRRSHLGTCLLLLPKWAFRPPTPPPEAANPQSKGPPTGKEIKGAAKGRSKGGPSGGGVRGKGVTGPRTNLRDLNRLKMQPALEEMANLSPRSHDNICKPSHPCFRLMETHNMRRSPAVDTHHCVHQYLKVHFRPDTGLNSYDSLRVSPETQKSSGWRSQRMQFASSWHVLELSGRSPPSERCCHLCNPNLLEAWKAPPQNDERLTAFASDFVFPAQTHVASTVEAERSVTADPPIGLVNRYYPARCTLDDEKELVTRLERWRSIWHKENGGPYSTPAMVLNDRQSQGIAKAGNTFCRAELY